MSRYLAPPASLPGMAPSPPVPLGGIPVEPWSVPLVGHSLRASSIWSGLGGASCVPVGSALSAPVPQDTPSVGPHCLDSEENILFVPSPWGLSGVLAPSFD